MTQSKRNIQDVVYEFTGVINGTRDMLPMLSDKEIDRLSSINRLQPSRKDQVFTDRMAKKVYRWQGNEITNSDKPG